MFRGTISLFFASLFLACSTLLPLSDFSMIRELPKMYRNYSRITTSDEAGVIDFIGDYLLQGKELFGHNRQDKTPNGSNNVQFQQQANPLQAVFLQVCLSLTHSVDYKKEHPVHNLAFPTSDYQNELFRPPLA